MKSKRIFYVLCATLILFVVGGGATYYFASTTLSAGTQELSQRLADEQLANQKLDDLADLDKQYKRLEVVMPRIYDALPDQKLQSKIGVQLRNISAQSGMSLDSLTFPASTAPGPVSQTVKVGDVLAIPVTFQLTGTYEQLRQFLSLQESLDRYTNVTSLNISSGPNSKTLTFDVSLNVFMKP